MKHSLLFFSCLALFSCEQVVDFDYQAERKICLNCILNPDSTIHLSLYYTRTLDETGDFDGLVQRMSDHGFVYEYVNEKPDLFQFLI